MDDGSDYRNLQGRRGAADYREGWIGMIPLMKCAFTRTAADPATTKPKAGIGTVVRRPRLVAHRAPPIEKSLVRLRDVRHVVFAV